MKERLDMLLVKRSLAPSREKAKAILMSGIVYVNGQKEDKPGSTFADTVDIELRGQTMPYVSRGGYKLEKAITAFEITLKDFICADIGSSTGGFTDCMLQNGAKKVYAIDVGRGQLDWKLRCDERVISMEKTNIRYVEPEHIDDKIDFASIDVSFISLTKVLMNVYKLLQEEACVIALIKPQFEAGRDKVGKKGVVRDFKIHEDVIQNVWTFAKSIGFKIEGLTFSPIKGPEGNVEYLIHLSTKEQMKEEISESIIEKIVSDAKNTLIKED